MEKKKKYTPTFKAKVAFEAVKADKAIAFIVQSSRYILKYYSLIVFILLTIFFDRRAKYVNVGAIGQFKQY